MPKKLHDKLEREAREKGLVGKAKDKYVYGTMKKIENKKSKRKK